MHKIVLVWLKFVSLDCSVEMLTLLDIQSISAHSIVGFIWLSFLSSGNKQTKSMANQTALCVCVCVVFAQMSFWPVRYVSPFLSIFRRDRAVGLLPHSTTNETGIQGTLIMLLMVAVTMVVLL